MPKNEIIKSVGEIKNKIYTIRGVQVMLDSDLAEIYGYTTGAFNQQIQRNNERFDEDFRFQLTWDEVNTYLGSRAETPDDENLKSQIVISSWGGIRKLPYVFTEQGIYMLMTVLRGKLAVEQSKTLIRLFRSMKDYILDNNSIINRTIENTENILELKSDMKNIKNELSEMIKKSDISPLILDFSRAREAQEFLIMNGEVVKAKDTIIDLYDKAKREIILVDNYVGYKTLRLFLEVKPNLKITIYTSNNSYLRKSDIDDFGKERPDLEIKLIKSDNLIHDRFIILDEKTVYLSGGSSKDAGKRMTTIVEITDSLIKDILLKTLKNF